MESQDEYAKNTSGQGKSAIIPKEIRGWNWGAFLLTWIWAMGNKAWIGVLVGGIAWIMSRIELIGLIITLLISIILGVKGNEWAWKNKRWDSMEHFKKTQRRWAWWGLGIYVFGLLFYTFLELWMSEGF